MLIKSDINLNYKRKYNPFKPLQLDSTTNGNQQVNISIPQGMMENLSSLKGALDNVILSIQSINSNANETTENANQDIENTESNVSSLSGKLSTVADGIENLGDKSEKVVTPAVQMSEAFNSAISTLEGIILNFSTSPSV